MGITCGCKTAGVMAVLMLCACLLRFTVPVWLLQHRFVEWCRNSLALVNYPVGFWLSFPEMPFEFLESLVISSCPVKYLQRISLRLKQDFMPKRTALSGE